MGRVTRVARHLTEAEVKEKIKETVGFWRVQKWLVIYHGLVDPRPAEEIGKHTGLAVQTVHNLVSNYNRYGPGVMETPGKGGRRRAYFSREEEEAFLGPFISKAVTGQIATATEIKKAFEDRLGRTVAKSTIYRLLKRHGWRKVVPRPVHVQAEEGRQEEFKKSSHI